MFFPLITIIILFTYSVGCCSLHYIVRTNQNLEAINKHVLTKIENFTISPTGGSSVKEHLRNNRHRAENFSVWLFSILSKPHSLFHLKIFETVLILSGKPSLGLNIISI